MYVKSWSVVNIWTHAYTYVQINANNHVIFYCLLSLIYLAWTFIYNICGILSDLLTEIHHKSETIGILLGSKLILFS
jgi:hypothetical protein